MVARETRAPRRQLLDCPGIALYAPETLGARSSQSATPRYVLQETSGVIGEAVAVIATQHNRIVQRGTCDSSYFILGAHGLRAGQHLGEASRTLRMFPERVLVMGTSRLQSGLRLQSVRHDACARSARSARP